MGLVTHMLGGSCWPLSRAPTFRTVWQREGSQTSHMVAEGSKGECSQRTRQKLHRLFWPGHFRNNPLVIVVTSLLRFQERKYRAHLSMGEVSREFVDMF